MKTRKSTPPDAASNAAPDKVTMGMAIEMLRSTLRQFQLLGVTIEAAPAAGKNGKVLWIALPGLELEDLQAPSSLHGGGASPAGDDASLEAKDEGG